MASALVVVPILVDNRGRMDLILTNSRAGDGYIRGSTHLFCAAARPE